MSDALRLVFLQGGILACLLQVMFCTLLVSAIVGRLLAKHSAENQPAVATVCYGGTIAVLAGVILNMMVTVLVVRR